MLRELRPGEPRLIGPYRLVGQLGDGGMGRVYLGRSAGGRPVAVKVIHSHLAADPDFRIRFRREVAAARKVSGLFTAMLVDADVDAPEPWLATAYVPGPSLLEAIHDHGPLPLDSVLALAAGLAESLAAIHAAGVVHRDLKPSNVLLGQDGPCVIDFGISRAAEATSVTRAGFVLGSPGFMSPEQAEGLEVGPPTDIFSLGAVLAFAATGKPPFGTGSTAAMVYRIVYANPHLDDVPDGVRPMIARCLAKDPSQRPSATELLAEAEAVQPMTGWLPDPIINAFPDAPAPAVAEQLPLTIEPEEPPTGLATITGDPVPIVPHAQAVPAEAEAVPPAPEAAAPAAEAGPAEAELAIPEAETGPRDLEAAVPEADTMAPEADTITPETERAPAEAETALREADAPYGEAETAAREPAAAIDPAAATDVTSEAEPPAAVIPPPVAALPGRPRRRLAHPRVLGTAAAVILIGSAATGLALSGSSHPSASQGNEPAAAAAALPGTSTSAQTASSQPSPSASASAAKSSPRSSAASSKRPSAHPTTQNPVTQTQTTAPGSVPSSTRSTPKSSPKPSPKPTKKPTPKPTQPAVPSVSVSGAGRDSCAAIGSLRSSSGASVEYTFVNNSSVSVAVGSIDSAGNVSWQSTISPGAEFSPSAEVGQYWEVAVSGGGCLTVLDVDGGGQAVIT